MSKLWSKNKMKAKAKSENEHEDKNESELSNLVGDYTVGEDYILDLELIAYDIQASIAHAKGLEKIGFLEEAEVEEIVIALSKLSKQVKKGDVHIEIEDEDCHTYIENYLTKKLGSIGKKIHTGRSRNDQVLVATRLYMLDHLAQVNSQIVSLSEELLKEAEKYENIPMPGYSHTQQAMLSSVGHYFSAIAESLIDDGIFLSQVQKFLSKNPLGSAAGFGVSLDLPREFTTQELGFDEVQVNSLYCQNSRGKFESIYLEALSQVMASLGKLASDFLLFTTHEFSFFKADSNLTTGSSIMPQKQNFDLLEILRANSKLVTSKQFEIKSIYSGLISGYNRDLQLIKEPLFKSTKVTKDSLEISKIFIQNIEPDVENIKTKISKGIYAADIANEFVKTKNMPFRDAYNLALEKLEETDSKNELLDPVKNLKQKVSLGAPGNLSLNQIKSKLEQIR
jgi:argininosuccinate lyase